MLTSLCNQTLQWMGIRLVVPDDWQVVRHGLSPQRGQLALVDRYRQRLQLNWTQCKGQPDVDRMLEDDRAKQSERQRAAQLRPLRHIPRWRGHTRIFADSGNAVTRAVRFDHGTNRLLEAVVITTESPEDLALLEEILPHIVVEEPADAATRWRAFDADVTSPDPAWRLASLKAKPADVSWVFKQTDPANDGKATGAEATLRRMGMADVWWGGDAAAFIRGEAGRRGEIRDGRFGAAAATRSVGYEQGPRLKRLLGLLRERRDVVWVCGRCNAVYHLVTWSHRRRPVEPEAFRVACAATARGCRDA